MKRLGSVLLASLILFFTVPAMAATISISPVEMEVAVGQKFDVIVEATLDSWEYLTTLDFDIEFDPTSLSYDPATGMTPNSAWGANDFASADYLGSGIANMNGSTFETDLDWQNNGTFEIATFSFEAMAVGPAVLDFGFADFFQDNYKIEGAELVLNGTTVNVVPVPGAVWLLGTALIGLVGFRRKLK
jgi:hypothetical protein